MKKAIAFILSVVLILGVLGGCSWGEAEKAKIRLSEVTHSIFYAPQYVAISQGFFKNENLDVELTNGGGADKVMTSVLTGECDIGLAGPEACIYVLLEGKKDSPKVFAQLTNCDGSFIVGRNKEAFKWDNLRGKTIIGGRKGGVPEMTLEYVMNKNGVVPQKDAIVDTSVQFDMMAGAFTGGNGDYVTLFEPTATEVELAGQGYVLCSVGEQSGEIPYTAYFASQSYIKDNSDIIMRFTRAIAKSQQWVKNHTNEEIAQAISSFFPDTSLKVLTSAVSRYKSINAWKYEPVMNQRALERLEEVMESAGELEKRVNFNDLVDNSFAQKAIKQ